MVAIGIRYYKLHNAGIACIIWPQLRKEGNPGETVWDGRKKDESKYRLPVNTSVAVDLSSTGISTDTKFFLSENTLFGTDMWDSSQSFFYDPNSNVTACATNDELGGGPDGQERWKGIDKWAAKSKPNVVLAGTGLILAFLIARECAVRKETMTLPNGTIVTTWDLGPAPWNGHGVLLGKVVKDWNAALHEAKETKAINGGIIDKK